MVQVLNPLDPTPIADLSDPTSWFANHRVAGPELGSLLLLQPERAAEVLAQAGVPPPPREMRRGTNPGRIMAAESRREAGEPVAEPVAPAPPSAGAPKGDRGPLPPVQPARTPKAVQNPLDPDRENARTTPDAPLDIRSEAQRGVAPAAQGPSDFAKVLSGLKAIAPPAISAVQSPNAPQARFDATPRIDFAPAPRGGAALPIANAAQIIQALAQRGGLPQLSALLRR